jgi:hypothetical protein
VDRIGGLQDAILLAREMALIGVKDEFEAVEYSAARTHQTRLPDAAAGSSMAALPSWTRLGRVWRGVDAQPTADQATGDDYDITYLRHMIEHNGTGAVHASARHDPARQRRIGIRAVARTAPLR